MAQIRFEKVQKRFHDTLVVREFDLTIHDGEFFTFVGPSGCGKSTVLNMIAGLEPVTEGSLYFDDVVVNEHSPRERDVAMVFQSYALYPHMTVEDNIAFPLRMKKEGQEIIDSEVRRVTSLLGLEDLLRRRPRELSGGQRQRVALGRAIIRKPKVFLMDEPLSNLDARLRVDMRAQLKKLHQELNITTVYVTHDQAEALSLSERIAVLNRGEIQHLGTPQDVYLKPATLFVGGFIGSPPMNFVSGTIRKTQPPEIDCNGITLSPSLETTPVGTAVTIGIRPEDITISDKKSDGDIEITVSIVEPAGSFNWVDVEWKGVPMKGTANLETVLKPGEVAYMKFPEEKIVIFDVGSERRL